MRNVFILSEEQWADGSTTGEIRIGVYTSFKKAREMACKAHRATTSPDASIAYLIETDKLHAHAEISETGRCWRWFAAIEPDFREIKQAVRS